MSHIEFNDEIEQLDQATFDIASTLQIRKDKLSELLQIENHSLQFDRLTTEWIILRQLSLVLRKALYLLTGHENQYFHAPYRFNRYNEKDNEHLSIDELIRLNRVRSFLRERLKETLSDSARVRNLNQEIQDTESYALILNRIRGGYHTLPQRLQN